jgi:regulator of sirC expression with transglutaminase-like and TPR domain
VGQVLLNLPNSTAKLSLAGGIFVQLGCAAAAVYTLFLLVALYMEHKRTEVGRRRAGFLMLSVPVLRPCPSGMPLPGRQPNT